MKRVFNYGTAVALAIMLAFAACDNSSDDGGGGGGGYTPGITIPSYQSDLDGIAIAFADGAPEAYLKNDLIINKGELVIPPGKTLKLTDYNGSGTNTITGFEDGAKLVILGDIEFPSSHTKDIDIRGVNAYVIIYQDKVSTYIRYGDLTAENMNTHIIANQDQVIHVLNFSLADPNAWQNAINNQAAQGATNNYLAVTHAGAIDSTISANISKYASGRRVYIIDTGKDGITFNGDPIDIKAIKYPDTLPPINPSVFARNAAFDETDGSLLVAGKVKFEGNTATVSTAGGFTILGGLTTGEGRSSTPINDKGPFAVYVANLDGGARFGEDVHLISKALTSDFGASVTFSGNVEANGPVVFMAAAFNGDSGNKAIFNGPVEFRGISSDVKKNGLGQFKLNGDVRISRISDETGNPVDPVALDTSFDKHLVYDQPYGTKGVATFNGPVTFNKSVTLEDNGALIFTGTADNGAAITFMDVLTVKGTPNAAGSLAAGSLSFGGPVTFKNTATFGSAAYFNDAVTFENTATFTTAPKTFSGNAIFGNVTFTNTPPTFESSAGTEVFFNGTIDNYAVTEMKGDVTFAQIFSSGTTAELQFAGNATFNEKATFTNNAVFGTLSAAIPGGVPTSDKRKTAKFLKSVEFGSGGTFAGNTIFNDSVILSTASNQLPITFANITYSQNGRSIVFIPEPTNSGTLGTIKPEAGGQLLSISNGYLTVAKAPAGGTVNLGTVSATFSGGAGLVLAGSTGLVFTGSGSVNFDAYTIKGEDAGSLLSSKGYDPVTLTSDGIKADSSKFGSLALSTKFILALKGGNNITLDAVNLDLSIGGTINVTGTGNVAIAISGGTVGKDTGATQVAGGIKPNTAGSISGGTLSYGYAYTTSVPWGLILANGPANGSGMYTGGKFVTTNGNEEYTLGSNDINMITNTSILNLFSTSSTVTGIDNAWTIVGSLGSASSPSGVGSVAVFTTSGAPVQQ
jgi:hypothetical protein